MFQTFDGPSGEVCVARREISDTPLQALTLLNDAVFMETSQAAGKLIAARVGSDSEKAAYLFKRFLTRPATPAECASLVTFVTRQKSRLAAGEVDAVTLSGAAKTDAQGAVVDRAAWTAAARVLLNLDEFVSRQ